MSQQRTTLRTLLMQILPTECPNNRFMLLNALKLLVCPTSLFRVLYVVKEFPALKPSVGLSVQVD